MEANGRTDRRKGKKKLYLDPYYDYRSDAMGDECRPRFPSRPVKDGDGRESPPSAIYADISYYKKLKEGL